MKTTNAQIEGLEKQSYEVQRTFADEVGEQVKEFTQIKYSNHTYGIGSTVYEVLLDSKYDHQSELWNIRYTAMDIIEVLSCNKSREEMTERDLQAALKMLRKLIEFTGRLEGEEMEAELDMVLIEEFGTDNIGYIAHLKDDYTKKIKLANYEKQLERA